MLQTKQVNSEFIKAVTERGTFEGLLSPYNYQDSGSDIVEPGAYTKNLAEKGNRRPLLWQHQTDNPIGELLLEDRPEGLWAKGQLLLSIPQAKAAYELIRAGVVSGLSIGFMCIRDNIDKGVRHLKEIRLYEGSIVTFPMAEIAHISNVKTLNHSHIELALKSFRDDILRELKGNS